ncbi:hypothetical protein F5148DRAFT_1185928 [Russula earlei]|uniref:Uncharacterized protein n=1 Tax=Russula earlei TaxID=71964 RepID=A0ACC0UDN5_9AGAM|nr:hypothetical protein F5148DRAFT_1185928 [Russula earlei]
MPMPASFHLWIQVPLVTTMRTCSVFVILCLAVGIVPSFALPSSSLRPGHGPSKPSVLPSELSKPDVQLNPYSTYPLPPGWKVKTPLGVAPSFAPPSSSPRAHDSRKRASKHSVLPSEPHSKPDVQPNFLSSAYSLPPGWRFKSRLKIEKPLPSGKIYPDRRDWMKTVLG